MEIGQNDKSTTLSIGLFPISLFFYTLYIFYVYYLLKFILFF